MMLPRGGSTCGVARLGLRDYRNR